jgi:hypothetical protein
MENIYRERPIPNRFELVLRQLGVVKELRKLSIGNKIMKDNKSIILTARELLYLHSDVTSSIKHINYPCHVLNQIFVAGRIPFYARIAGSDKVKIGRVSKNFDPGQYASEEGLLLKGKSDMTAYEEPNYGIRESVKYWLLEYGINFEDEPVDEEDVSVEITQIPENIKNRDRIAYKILESDYMKYITEKPLPAVFRG